MRFSLFATAAMAAASSLLAGTMAQVTPMAGMTADSYCGDGFCITAVMTSASNVNYTLVVPKGGMQIGWVGIGQGEQMSGANMAVNWINPDMSLVTSHRSTTGHADPTEAKATVQGFSVNSDVSKTMSGLTIWSWTWPLLAGSPQNAQPHVHAVASTNPQGTASSSAIRMHDSYDTGITLDLTKTYTGEAPAGLPAAATVSSSSSSSQEGGMSGQMRDLGKMSTRVFLVHMIFMILGWQLCFPIGILLARYGRTVFTWFPAHRAVNSVGYLFVFIAFFLAIGNISALGYPHLENTHEKVGVALFVLLFVQVLLGVFAHEVRKRRGLRYLGYVHIPFGLILYGLSVWQIHLGFDVWEWKPPAAASYVIYAWAAFMAVLYFAGFALLPREIRRSRDEKQGYRGDQSPSENMPVMGQR